MLSGGFDIYLRTKHVRPIIKEHKRDDVIAQDLKVKDDPTSLLDADSPDLSGLAIPTFFLEGDIRNARTGQPVANAEISVREIYNPKFPMKYATKIMLDTKRYSVKEIEKDREFEITDLNRDMMGERFRLLKVGNDTLIIVNANERGHYKVELEKEREFEVTAQAADLFFDSFKVRVEKKDASNQTKDFYVPEELTLRVNFPSNVFNNPYKFTLDSNGIETNKTWQEEIDLLTQNLLLSKDKIEKIKLIGHTDEVGSDEYNEKLGLDRVLFVVAELVKRGVPEVLLAAESAGELKPLSSRESESKDIYQKRLRRVELQKLVKEK
jgi:outer membrane protein OmpA-like peptidoglycan-associated protein